MSGATLGLPANALTTQFAAAAQSAATAEASPREPAALATGLVESHAASERDADGKYSGGRKEEPEEEREHTEGVRALGRTRSQRRIGHLLERLAGLGALLDAEY